METRFRRFCVEIVSPVCFSSKINNNKKPVFSSFFIRVLDSQSAGCFFKRTQNTTIHQTDCLVSQKVVNIQKILDFSEISCMVLHFSANLCGSHVRAFLQKFNYSINVQIFCKAIPWTGSKTYTVTFCSNCF